MLYTVSNGTKREADSAGLGLCALGLRLGSGLTLGLGLGQLPFTHPVYMDANSC